MNEQRPEPTQPPRKGGPNSREIAFIVLMLALGVAAAFLMEWYLSGLT